MHGYRVKHDDRQEVKMLYVIGNGEAYEDWGIECLVESESSPEEIVKQFREAHRKWHDVYIAFLTKLNNETSPPKNSPHRPKGMKMKEFEALPEYKAWHEACNTWSTKRGQQLQEWTKANPEPKLEEFLHEAGFKSVEYEIVF